MNTTLLLQLNAALLCMLFCVGCQSMPGWMGGSSDANEPVESPSAEQAPMESGLSEADSTENQNESEPASQPVEPQVAEAADRPTNTVEESIQPPSPSVMPPQQVIVLDERGRFFVGTQLLDKAILEALDPELPVLVKMDPKAPIEAFIALIDELDARGIQDVKMTSDAIGQ